MADEHDTDASELTDELAKKYDPERLLKIISKKAGRGEALELSVRQKYESMLKTDLGHVRVYSGEFAEEFNKKNQSYAVTVGSSGIVLMGGSPDKSMGSAEGKALLGHELTHVAQKAGGLHAKARGDLPFAYEDEVEANAVEDHVKVEEAGGAGSLKQDSEDNPTSRHFKLAGQKSHKEAMERIKQHAIDLITEQMRGSMLRSGGGGMGR